MARSKTDPLDEKAKRFPRTPRIVLGAIIILPELDEDNRPIKDSWVVPGRRVMTTDEVKAMAKAAGLMFFNSGDRKYENIS